MRHHTVTLGWALKRALLGIFILFVGISGAAWLLYASIDPRLDLEPSGAMAAPAVSAPAPAAPYASEPGKPL